VPQIHTAGVHRRSDEGNGQSSLGNQGGRCRLESTATHTSKAIRQQPTIESALIHTGGDNRPEGEHPVIRMAVTVDIDGTTTVFFEDELWLVRRTKHPLADYEFYMKMLDWKEIRAGIQKLAPPKNRISRGLGYTP